mgnify:CR=1 FL=1
MRCVQQGNERNEAMDVRRAVTDLSHQRNFPSQPTECSTRNFPPLSLSWCAAFRSTATTTTLVVGVASIHQ